MENAELVHKLMCLMFGHRPLDHAPITFDAIFVFGRANKEWEAAPYNEGILETAARLFVQGVAPRIVIPGYKGNPDGKGGIIPTAYPGWSRWQDKLKCLHVPTRSIEKTRGLGSNTKTEGNDFVFMAKEQQWTTALIVTQPHQMLRAMLGLINTMQLMAHQMTILPVCPSQIDWTAKTYGSQGEKCIPRHMHTDEEWKRIPRYQEQGDLATLEELNVYLNGVLLDVYS